MRISEAVGLAGRRAAWRATRSLSVGRPLVEALGSSDEDRRVFAGVLLTRAGRKIEPLLLDALTRHENVPAVLEVLGGIGDETADRAISQYLDDPDPEIAEAAKSSKSVIEMQRRMRTDPAFSRR